MKEIRYEYRPEMARSAMLSSLVRVAPYVAGVWALAAILCTVAYFMRWTGILENVLGALVGGTIVLSVLVPVMIQTFTMKTNNEWKKLDDKFTEIRFFDDRITVTTPLASSDIPWSTFSRFTFTNEYCHLWYRNRICMVIPRASMNGEHEEMIRSKITSRK